MGLRLCYRPVNRASGKWIPELNVYGCIVIVIEIFTVSSYFLSVQSTGNLVIELITLLHLPRGHIKTNFI